MIKRLSGGLALALVAATSPVSAAVNCGAGYKSFLEKITPTIPVSADADLSVLMRRALSVYDACAAGDMFQPTGIWDQIATDLQASAKKK